MTDLDKIWRDDAERAHAVKQLMCKNPRCRTPMRSKDVLRQCDITIFKLVAVCHLGFLKLKLLIAANFRDVPHHQILW